MRQRNSRSGGAALGLRKKKGRDARKGRQRGERPRADGWRWHSRKCSYTASTTSPVDTEEGRDRQMTERVIAEAARGGRVVLGGAARGVMRSARKALPRLRHRGNAVSQEVAGATRR